MVYSTSDSSFWIRVSPSTRSSSLRAYDSLKYPCVPNASPGTTATIACSSISEARWLLDCIVSPFSVLPMNASTFG